MASDYTDEGNEDFRLRLDHPRNAGVNSLSGEVFATGRIIDDDAAPTITISDGVASVLAFGTQNEATTFTFTVRLSNPSSRDIRVNYATGEIVNADGTQPKDHATSAVDFVPNSNVLLFTEGETEMSFPVTVLDDPRDEDNERFLAAIDNVQTYPAGSNSPDLDHRRVDRARHRPGHHPRRRCRSHREHRAGQPHRE